MTASRFPASARSVRAFTLIELLVSITVLTMLVVMFSQALGSITTAWGRAQEKMDNFAKARTMLSRLQVDLQHLVDRDDLANFGLEGTDSVLGFYTLQRGFRNGATGSNSRALSYVEYNQLERDDRQVLERTTRSFSYDDDSPQFLPAPTPSAGTTPPTTPPPEAVDTGAAGFGKFDALHGVLAFAKGFLHPDGQYSTSFYKNSSGENSRAVAVKIGMVVTDNKTALILQERGDLTRLANELVMDEPSGKNWSPKAAWDYQLGTSLDRPAGVSAHRIEPDTYGATFVDSIRAFERTYSFPSSNL